MKKFALASLGCPKNLVDSEVFANICLENDYTKTDEFNDANLIIVNTCGFIQDAKEEAIDTILEMCEITKNDPNKELVVTGCFVKRYFDVLKKEFPEVDHFVNLKDFQSFMKVINAKKITETRSFLTPGHYGYLRISDGCDNRCTYCAIPDIRGIPISETIENLVAEAESMVKSGRREIIVTAQDTTQYGIDIYGKPMLSELLRQLSKIENLKWIRLLYLHPAHLTEEMIDTIAELDNVCNYFEIPLQHISDKILKKMNRKTDGEYIKNILKMIKSKVPDAFIRTTFIVGFPGETEDDFNQLVEFVKEQKFIRMGVFGYSTEEDTPAASFDNLVDEETIQLRKDKLMMIQQEISENVLASFIDKEIEVVIEVINEDNDFLYEGRSVGDSPEIDGIVYITAGKAQIGDYVKVKIEDSWEYDLVGRII